MNIALFADLHGRISLCFKLCARWEQETGERLDLILQAGDLGAYPVLERLDRATIKHAKIDPTELGFLHDFATYQPKTASLLTRTQATMLFVRGNHEDHGWLDAQEHSVDGPYFPIDAYRRIYCLKSGLPFTFQAGEERIHILGVGRIGAPVGEQQAFQAKYVQAYEMERIYALEASHVDLLLTHDAPLHMMSSGYGMEEIRLLLDHYQPAYHFFGHYGGSALHRLDSNGRTISCKLADLNWDVEDNLDEASMAILHWHSPQEHSLEILKADWLEAYTRRRWQDQA